MPIKSLTSDILIKSAFGNFFNAWKDDTLTDSNVRLMRKDPTIKLGIGMIKNPIQALNYKWDVDTTEEQGKKQLEYAKLFLDPYIRFLSSQYLLSLEFGRQSLKKKYDPLIFDNNKYWVPTDFISLKPEDVYVQQDEYGRYAGIKYDNVEYDKKVCVHFSYGGEYREEMLYGKSIYEPTYQSYYRYQVIWLNYVRYLEKQGAATAKVLYPEDTTDSNGKVTDNASIAKTVGESLKSGSTAAFPSVRDDEGNLLWDVEYLDSATDGSHFINAMNQHETLFMRSLGIPDAALTRPGGATGTLAESKERGETFTTSLEYLSQDRDAEINAQIVDQLMALNFDNPIPMKMVSEPIIDEDRILIGKLFEKVIATDSRGKEIVIQEFADRYNWDLEEVMELIEIKREVLDDDRPETPNNKKEQADGGQQEQMDAEYIMDRELNLASQGELFSL